MCTTAWNTLYFQTYGVMITENELLLFEHISLGCGEHNLLRFEQVVRHYII